MGSEGSVFYIIYDKHKYRAQYRDIDWTSSLTILFSIFLEVIKDKAGGVTAII